MKIYDFLIIYLACGAPIGVYYYFQNRRLYSKQLWLKTVLTFMFWIPFFVHLLLKSRIRANSLKLRRQSKKKLAEKTARLQSIKRELENILSDSDSSVSIYDFREVFERFVGLTQAHAKSNAKPFDHEKELYRISGFHHQEFSAVCLHRRNQKRLYFHQIEAEKDFVKLIASITDSTFEIVKLEALVLELIALLNNDDAQEKIAQIFEAKLQTDQNNSVSPLERELWKPEPLKQSSAKQISMR